MSEQTGASEQIGATERTDAHDRADTSERPGTPASAESPRAIDSVVEADGAAGTETASAILTEDQVKAALRKVKDPELNLNIMDLGLVYAITVEGARVSIDMSLTSPGCP